MNVLRTEPGDRQARDLAILARTSRLFNEPLELEDAMFQVIRTVATEMECLVALLLPDAHLQHLQTRLAYHPDPEQHALLGDFLAVTPLALNATLTGIAFRAGQDLLVPDTAAEPRFAAVFREQLGMRSFITATIYSRGKMLGMFSAARTVPGHPFDETDMRVIRAVADQAANALANASFLEAEVALRQRAEVLLKVAKLMRSDLPLPLMWQDAVDVTWQFLRPDFVGIFQLDEQHRFQLAAASELEDLERMTRFPAADPGSLLGRILRGGGPVHLVQLDHEPMLDPERELIRPESSTCCSAVPLYGQNSPTGVLLVVWRGEAHPHLSEDLELITGIGELIAAAAENQRLIQQQASIHAARLMAVEVAREREALIRQIVHDLRNSTQAISLVNEEIEYAAKDHPDILYGVHAIDRQVTFISSFLKEKLNWITHLPTEPAAGTTDFAGLVHRLADEHATSCQRGTLVLEEVPPGIHLPVSEANLSQILGALLENACRALAPGGEVRMWCALSDGWITIYVADNGAGIPLEQQARLDDTDQDLARVKRLATEGGGLFGFHSRPGEGSTFYVTLPTTRWGRAG